MADLGEKEEVVIDLDSHEPDEGVDNSDFSVCLAGRVASEKTPNTYALFDVLKKAWKVNKNFSAREWGPNLFLFKFGTKAELEWVLRHQPWHFDNQLIAITPLKGNEQPSSLRITSTSFWMRAYDLPLSCLNMRTARAVGAKLGSFEEMDENLNGYAGSYLRFKVALDITKPFLRGISIKLAGEKLWIPLKYESLPVYCFSCGLIGHSSKQCKIVEQKTYKNIEDIPFGPIIKASPIKHIRSHKDHRTPFKPAPSHTNPPKSQSELISKTKAPPKHPHTPQNLALIPFGQPLTLDPSKPKYIPPQARHNHTHTTNQPSSPTKPSTSDGLPGQNVEPSHITAKTSSKPITQMKNKTSTRSSISARLKTPMSPERPRLTPSKRQSGEGVYENDDEISQVFKKLKKTALVDIPCTLRDTAEIAALQSRREL